MVKKIAGILLILTIFLQVSGCGGGQEKGINKDKDRPKPSRLEP